jgi:hypothetical protein
MVKNSPEKEIELHPYAWAALRARRWRGCQDTAATSVGEEEETDSDHEATGAEANEKAGLSI